MLDNFISLIAIFILASCFYKKHIRNWWWFKAGLFAFAGVIGVIILSQLVRGVYALASLTQLILVAASGACFVVACLHDARRQLEHLRCLHCGYILKGLTEPRCPECGQAI